MSPTSLFHETMAEAIANEAMNEIVQDTISPMPFDATSLSLRTQKKLLSKISSRAVVKHFITEEAARLFDNFYRFLKHYYSKAVSEKVVKNMIKIVMKLGLLARYDQFTEDEQPQLTSFQQQLHTLSLTVISFGTVPFSYDRIHLLRLMQGALAELLPIVRRHLSEKSVGRIQMVFDHISKPAVLDGLFNMNSEHSALRDQMLSDLELLIDINEL
ncbi:hypothetical protein AB6A40_002203 [Gnathostoma spinigerum]|uniref:Uncharacterized protein n=1 Tax=Gnathostoma spinigerum TaxID=75299 RepID=A0ABD6E602_9BILA